MLQDDSIPLRATVEKQNCGVSMGCRGRSVMMSRGSGVGRLVASVEGAGRLDQSIPASLSVSGSDK